MQPSARLASWGQEKVPLVLKRTRPLAKFQDHQGLRDLVAPASSSGPCPPDQACLREGEAQHLVDHPHLPLRA